MGRLPRSVVEKLWSEQQQGIYEKKNQKMNPINKTKILLALAFLSDIMLIKSDEVLNKKVSTKLFESVELSCSSNSPWFFCVWEGPRGDRVCSLRSAIKTGGGSMCGQNEKMEIKGNASSCSLVLPRPELHDHGSWTCAISDDKSLETM